MEIIFNYIMKDGIEENIRGSWNEKEYYSKKGCNYVRVYVDNIEYNITREDFEKYFFTKLTENKISENQNEIKKVYNKIREIVDNINDCERDMQDLITHINSNKKLEKNKIIIKSIRECAKKINNTTLIQLGSLLD
jgi:hypothetical protein